MCSDTFVDKTSTTSQELSGKKEVDWILYNGEKYNIRHFLRNHPGGANTLSNWRGKEVTSIMKRVEHSPAAFHLLKSSRPEAFEKDPIDWSKPIFWQVGKLGANYMEWTLSPVERNLRLFHSDFAERMSKTKWYCVAGVWIPVIIYLITITFNNLTTLSPSSRLLLVGFSITAGAVKWTLVEYVMHRWVFHSKPPANWPLLITLHFGIHGIHHKAPFDEARLMFPPVPATIIATILYFCVYSVYLPSAICPAVFAGSLIGYIVYDFIHLYLHHGSPIEGSYFYFMKRYHNRHHFSHHHIGFGISSVIWDYFFSTLIKLQDLSHSLIWDEKV